MDINDLIAAVTEGLSPEQAQQVKAAIERDTVKAKASTWKQQNEYQALLDRQNQLQQELEGDPSKPETDPSRFGAKAYKAWHDKNITSIRKLEADMQKYVEKYGTLESPTVPNNPTVPTMDEIINKVRQEVLSGYAPANAVAGAMSSQMKVLQKHFLAGRKNPVDVDTVMKLAGEKYQGNLEMAYDEWDKPERERIDKEEREKEIDRRVNEKLQQRGASQHFPAGADLTPSALSARTKTETDKFDRASLTRDLATTWLNGPGDGVTQ